MTDDTRMREAFDREHGSRFDELDAYYRSGVAWGWKARAAESSSGAARAEGPIELPPITDDDRQFLHDNPNTADAVEWVRDYARRAILASTSSREAEPPNDGEFERKVRSASRDELIYECLALHRESRGLDDLVTRVKAQAAEPSVENSIAQLVAALSASKGWLRAYADALIRDAIDRRAEPSAAVRAENGAEQVTRSLTAEHPVAKFLLGEGELDGISFDEAWRYDNRPEGKDRFWWRDALRQAIEDNSKQSLTADNPQMTTAASGSEQKAMNLPDRIAELVAQHGSLRAAARVLQIEPGYLSRLHGGEKGNPGAILLARMGLKRVVSYERIADKRALAREKSE